MIRMGLRSQFPCRYRVIAAGIDHKDRIISIATNLPYLPSRGRHAEERVIHQCPRNLLSRILLIRVNARGEKLPIHPCPNCQRLARKRGIKIESI